MRLFWTIKQWLTLKSQAELDYQYLCEAVDLVDLERRQHQLQTRSIKHYY